MSSISLTVVASYKLGCSGAKAERRSAFARRRHLKRALQISRIASARSLCA